MPPRKRTTSADTNADPMAPPVVSDAPTSEPVATEPVVVEGPTADARDERIAELQAEVAVLVDIKNRLTALVTDRDDCIFNLQTALNLTRETLAEHDRTRDALVSAMEERHAAELAAARVPNVSDPATAYAGYRAVVEKRVRLATWKGDMLVCVLTGNMLGQVSRGVPAPGCKEAPWASYFISGTQQYAGKPGDEAEARAWVERMTGRTVV